MIEINCLDDVPIFLGAQRLTDYFRGKVGYLLATYDVDSLKSVGSVFYVTTPEDWEQSAEIGLSRPMKDYMAESANVLKIPTDSGGMIAMCHGTVALNNSTAIEIYCPPELMPEHTFDDWFRDWKEADSIYI